MKEPRKEGKKKKVIKKDFTKEKMKAGKERTQFPKGKFGQAFGILGAREDLLNKI